MGEKCNARRKKAKEKGEKHMNTKYSNQKHLQILMINNKVN